MSMGIQLKNLPEQSKKITWTFVLFQSVLISGSTRTVNNFKYSVCKVEGGCCCQQVCLKLPVCSSMRQKKTSFSSDQ